MKDNIKNKFAIILPTHSSYSKTIQTFLQLFKKNWPDCQFKIIASITGDNKKINGVESFYNGKNASLVECITNATRKYNSQYYIIFLGDAFINKKVDNVMALELFKQLYKNHIDYCSLNCVKKYKKEKIFNKQLRHINNLDRYSHSFVAFVASRNYIEKELSKFKSDLEFEENYLHKLISDDFYYDNHLIVRKNYFNILPSITKGKWDRINYLKLKRSNPEIQFEEREQQAWIETIIHHARKYIITQVNPSTRIKLKRFVESSLKIKFGVKD